MIMTNVRGVLFNDVVVFGKASAAGNPQSVRTLGGKVSRKYVLVHGFENVLASGPCVLLLLSHSTEVQLTGFPSAL